MLNGATADAALTWAAPHDVCDRFIARPEAFRILGISTSTGARYERSDPDFPTKYQLSKYRFAFRLSDLRRYVATRPVVAAAPRDDPARVAREHKKAKRAQGGAP